MSDPVAPVRVPVQPPRDQSDDGRAPIGLFRLVLMLLPLVLFGALAVIFYAQLKSGKDNSTIPSALIGKKAPQFTLPTVAGMEREGVALDGFGSTELAGRISIVNVWASWCVPCRQEHPVLMELAKDGRVQMLGINYKDKPENARRFLGQLGNPFAAIGSDPNGRAAIDWGVYGIPETFIVGPDGTIRHKHVGPIGPQTHADIKAKIDAIAAGK
jgi:cytochrome c biogenesis protein CcmG/thiol:disulfide interchange protein DsbE